MLEWACAWMPDEYLNMVGTDSYINLPVMFVLGNDDQSFLLDAINSFGPAAIAALVAVLIAAWQAKGVLKTYFKQKKIETLQASISDVYDPLLALMAENKELFEKVGPPSFPTDHTRREIAATVWEVVRPKILENNLSIRSILIERSQKIDVSDGLSNYQELIVHLTMYEVEQTVKSDIIERFRFPENIVGHIQTTKSRLQGEILEMSR